MSNHYSPKTQFKGLLVFITVVIFLLMAIETIAKNEAVVPIEIKAEGLGYVYPSYDEKIEWERKKHLEKLSKEMVEAKKNKINYRPLKGELKGKEEVFLTSFSNREIGKYVISVLVAESGGGQNPCGRFNYSGIMKNGRCQNFESLEDYIEHVIKARTGKYFNELYKVGVTRETLNNVFIGSYCQSGCEHWVDNFVSTYEKL